MVTLKESLTSQIKVPKIAALEWLNQSTVWPLLDVRSEGEFQEGHIPGSVSGPILTNTERHLVGLTYKQKGQEAAIALGLSLVEKFREERIEQWLRAFPNSIAVTCWRGGLRSRFASGWLEKAVGESRDIVQIAGGYKALRRELLKVIETPREMWVLGGMTGSGKTDLLIELKKEGQVSSERILDLEGLARHRGSSFGNQISSEGTRLDQPRQQTFENAMGLQLFKAQGSIILENESTLIGKVFIPQGFRARMKSAPVVILDTPMEERARAIFNEYIKEPLASGCSPEKLWVQLELSLKALERRLGGKETSQALKLLSEGATDPSQFEKQRAWIELLLIRYYDKAYTHSLQISEQRVVFQGNRSEVKEWIIEKMGR